jgi:hypothetical protein
VKYFKKCTCSASPWITRDEFLQDENTQLVGYQANFSHLELGYFLFNHLTCKTTIAIPAGLFKDLYAGPVFSQRLTGSEVCHGYCKEMEVLEPCENQCECAYIREIVQLIRNWPKAEYQVDNTAEAMSDASSQVSAVSQFCHEDSKSLYKPGDRRQA